MTKFAWRCWDVGPDGSLYSPLNFGQHVFWLPNQWMTARCEAAHDHAVPDEACGCGWRAMQHLPSFIASLALTREDFLPKVIGVVELGGRLAGRDRHGDPPGTTRAERAKVVGPVFMRKPFASSADGMSRGYGIDVVIADSDDDMAWLDQENLPTDVERYAKSAAGLRCEGRLLSPAGHNSRRSAMQVLALSVADPAPPDWNEVVPGLWQGSAVSAPTRSDFDAVVTVCEDACPVGEGVDEHWLPLEDDAYEPNADELQNAVDWLTERWQAGKRCLVRCQKGWNRSGLIVGLTLKAAGTEPVEAIRQIRSARGTMALHNGTFTSLILGTPVPDTPRWGVEGAAGILFRRPSDGRYLLLRRSSGTIAAGRWGIPGGGLLPNEDPWHAAVRESVEEIGTHPDSLTPSGSYTHTDADGWRYTTFLVDAEPTIRLNDEHDERRWVTSTDTASMRMHPDLERDWSRIVAA
jgi:8-oxo-dGTP pyrophosphatase MutT (NUDIX family)